MKIKTLSPGSIDWAKIEPILHQGETGRANSRAYQLGDIQLRLVEYSLGYVADHWCHKGHVLFVVSGALAIEHQDGQRYTLGPGMSWHAADNQGAPHRVICIESATVFIVD